MASRAACSDHKTIADFRKENGVALRNRRMAQIEESIARYLHQLDSADRQDPSEAILTKTADRAAEGKDRAVEAGDGPACDG